MPLIDRDIWNGELITEEILEASREDWKNMFTTPVVWHQWANRFHG
jgi:hypothetical protein